MQTLTNDSKQDALTNPTDKEGETSSIASSSSTVVNSHESFETFQHKVYALGVELGVNFKDITRIRGGTNNRIIAVTMKDVPNEAGITENTQAILRIPRVQDEYDSDGNKVPYVGKNNVEILDDAAVLNLIAGHVPKIAKVLAFDITHDNAIGSPWTLYTRMSGVNLHSVLYDIPLENMATIASELAEYYTSLQRFKFPCCGRLLHDDEKAPGLTKLPLKLSERAGVAREVAVCGFLENTGEQDERDGPTIQMASSFYELIKTGLEDRLRSDKGLEPGELDWNARYRDRLHSMLEEMKSMGWFDTDELSTTDSVLDHPGCEPQNITVEQHEDSTWHLTGVVDWDEIICLPPVLTRRPPLWLWDRFEDDLRPDENLQRLGEDNWDFMSLEINAEQLTAEGAKIKETYEQAIIKSIYEPRYGERAGEVYQDDAYGRGRMLRQMWRFAYEGTLHSAHWYRFKQLRREWADLTQTERDSDDDDDDASSYASNSTAVYGHEPFETFKHKVIALGPELGVTFDDIEHMKGGTLNRVIALTMQNPPGESKLSDNTQAVLRVPRADEEEPNEQESDSDDESSDASKTQVDECDDGSIDSEAVKHDNSTYAWFRASKEKLDAEAERREILDEAAILSLLVRFNLKVPKVLAFDITRENALKLPYSLHTRLPGTSLDNVFGDMSVDDKVVIAEELAAFLARLDTIRFAASGRIIYDESATIAKLPLDLSRRIQVGENVVVRGFYRGPDMFDGKDRPFAPTTSTLYDLLSTHIHDQIQCNDYLCPNDSDPKFPKLQAILHDMKAMGWFASAKGSTEYSIVHHWDFEPGNIMVEQSKQPGGVLRWHVTGIVDWDEAQCVPPVLTRKPPTWLWDFSDDDLLPSAVQKYFDSDSDMLPLEFYKEINADHLTAEDVKIKERFEQVLVEKLYQRYGSKALEAYQDDAYGRGRWLRRVWRFANEGIFSSPNHDDRFDQLLKEWTEFKQTGQVSHDTVFCIASVTSPEEDMNVEAETASPIAVDTEVFTTEPLHEVEAIQTSHLDKSHWRAKVGGVLRTLRCVTM
ncbi:hypothetical protein E4T39_03959 [Aureobasidium subglaciale]|nr:hypothetical protein E4T39_03959 [Aureobasidium subglaciale]